jgi:hypothetical protein
VFAHLVGGYIEPWLPQATVQNEAVIRAIFAAFASYCEDGFEVVLDGVVGPWFLTSLDHRLPSRMPVDYMILLPTLETAQRRVAGHTRHGFTDEAGTAHMHQDFESARAAFERHVLDSTALAPGRVADAIGAAATSGASGSLATANASGAPRLLRQASNPRQPLRAHLPVGRPARQSEAVIARRCAGDRRTLGHRPIVAALMASGVTSRVATVPARLVNLKSSSNGKATARAMSHVCTSTSQALMAAASDAGNAPNGSRHVLCRSVPFHASALDVRQRVNADSGSPPSRSPTGVRGESVRPDADWENLVVVAITWFRTSLTHHDVQGVGWAHPEGGTSDTTGFAARVREKRRGVGHDRPHGTAGSACSRLRRAPEQPPRAPLAVVGPDGILARYPV